MKMLVDWLEEDESPSAVVVLPSVVLSVVFVYTNSIISNITNLLLLLFKYSFQFFLLRSNWYNFLFSLLFSSNSFLLLILLKQNLLKLRCLLLFKHNSASHRVMGRIYTGTTPESIIYCMGGFASIAHSFWNAVTTFELYFFFFFFFFCATLLFDKVAGTSSSITSFFHLQEIYLKFFFKDEEIRQPTCVK